MKSLTSRLEKLEAKRGGPTRIWVTIDDGATYNSNGETLTGDELAARYPDPTVFRVIHVDYKTDMRTLPDEALEAICSSPAGVQMKALSDDELARIVAA